MTPSPRPKLVARLVLMFASLLLCVVIVEVALRLFMPVSMLHVSYEQFRMSPNARIGYELRPLVEDHNRDGWRDQLYPREKDDAIYRIAIIGDSLVYGHATPLGQTYPKQLERLLNEEGSCGSRVEVLNFGVPGYGITQIVESFRAKGADWHPDLVIYGYWLDDVTSSGEHRESIERRRADGEAREAIQVTDSGRNRLKELVLATQIGRRAIVLGSILSARSEVDLTTSLDEQLAGLDPPVRDLYARYLQRVRDGELRDLPTGEPYFATYVDHRRFAAWIDAMQQWVATCESLGAKPLLLMTPVLYEHDTGDYRWTELHGFVADLMEHFDVPVLDVSDRLTPLSPSLIAHDSEHPNARGCTIIAAALHEHLVTDGAGYGLNCAAARNVNAR